jgi:hypothetical protein
MPPLPDQFAIQASDDRRCFFAVATCHDSQGQTFERWELKPGLMEVESPSISPQVETAHRRRRQ